MEPLHQFIIDLETFIQDHGYEIRCSEDIDLVNSQTGSLIGYWPSTISADTFRELDRSEAHQKPVEVNSP